MQLDGCAWTIRRADPTRNQYIAGMQTTPAPQVRRSVEVELAPDEVWELVVDDEERSGWFGGPSTLEAAPGGTGSFTDPDGTRRHATVDEVVEGRRLAWTWWPDGDDGAASRVQIDLRPTPGGTAVVVTEAPVVPVARATARSALRGGVPLLELELRCLLRAAAVVPR